MQCHSYYTLHNALFCVNRGVLVALLCENNSKVLTCGLLEPPKLFSLNELADTSDGDEYNHQSMNRAAPSSIVHLNDFDGFAPPTSILEVSEILLQRCLNSFNRVRGA